MKSSPGFRGIPETPMNGGTPKPIPTNGQPSQGLPAIVGHPANGIIIPIGLAAVAPKLAGQPQGMKVPKACGPALPLQVPEENGIITGAPQNPPCFPSICSVARDMVSAPQSIMLVDASTHWRIRSNGKLNGVML